MAIGWKEASKEWPIIGQRSERNIVENPTLQQPLVGLTFNFLAAKEPGRNDV